MSYQDLRALGESKARNEGLYRFDYPDPTQIEKIEAPQNCAMVTLRHTAWTGLCPKTNQPDSGTITIRYTPNKYLVESKSLKLYLMGFRQFGSFGEFVVSRVRADLEQALDPKFISVTGCFDPRGDISVESESVGGSQAKG